MQKLTYWLHRFMILTGIFVLCNSTFAHGQQPAPSPVVTLNVSDGTLSGIFEAIQSQSGLSVVYNVSDVNPNRRVSINASGEPLSSFLGRLFDGTDVTWVVNPKHIVLSLKKETAPAAPQGVSGTVLGADGNPLIGASVIVRGTNMISITDMNGKFQLNAKTGDVLDVSYVGYTKKEFTVTGSAPVSIVLEGDSTLIGEVVVTALGIKKEIKALTYNVQTVNSDAIVKVQDANFLNALSGKIAGVQINTNASGVGGSVRVVMRGPKAIFSENNALYVVDGIPLPSLRTEQSSQIYESPDGGDSDGMADLNPDDIESMSVLTGASAAALYGSQGANGVILITTKRGRTDGLRVSYSNSTNFTSPFVMPEFQNTYGSEVGSRLSWGNKLDKPTSYNPAAFFQTGYSTTNAVNIATGNDSYRLYVSGSALNARGLIPNSEYNRYNFTAAFSTDLVKDKLSLDLTFNYVSQNDQNRMIQGRQSNPLVPIYLFPRGDDIKKYEIYERYNAGRNFMTQYWPNEDELNDSNPWWITNRMMSNVDKNRYIAFASASWKIIDGLSLTGRVRMDNTDRTSKRRYYASTNLKYASETGNYQYLNSKTMAVYADAILNYRWMNEKFSIDANLGGILDDKRYALSGYEADLGLVANHFHASNMDFTSAESGSVESFYHDQTQSMFATAQFGWNSLYLDLTGRFEWPSMLNGASQASLFYPSVGLSGVVTDWVDMRSANVSLLKFRASYSEVGTPPTRYITSLRYPYVGGAPVIQTTAPAQYIKPERTKSFEAGINTRFFGNRLTFDFTYYNTNTYNQIFERPATSNRYGTYILNAGKVNNWGIEAVLGGNNDFGQVQWDSHLNFTMNRNKIVSLIPEGTLDPLTGEPMPATKVVPILSGGSFKIDAVEGGTMGDVYVNTLLKDFQGNIKVDPTLQTISSAPGTWIKAGSTAPKYELGWNNSIRYKNFDLSFLISARVGGIAISATQALMDRYGVSKTSADSRDAGGVVVNGTAIDALGYYTVTGGGTAGVLSEYVYSATNVRLKEASLAYTFPSKWFNDKIKGLTIAVTGTNLFLFYKKAPFDPEMTASTGTYYQGIDYFMMPSVRSVGFSVKLQF